jgi:hypothetical protein
MRTSLRPALIALLCLCRPALADVPSGRSFTSPDAAIQALIAATRAGNVADLVKIFGPAGRMFVTSGDPIADKAARARFVQDFDQSNKLDRPTDDKAILEIGDKNWPFPIPLIRHGRDWRFDTAAGEREILDRQIGRNELSAIEVCRAYVSAQQEFAHLKAVEGGLIEYARKFDSDPGTHDGLYWPAENGAPESPLGPLMASARAEGYGEAAGERTPYQGYFYKILTRQGPAAAGGAYDYVAKGHLIGGFALVAFPARWGDSGVMSFIVNQDGEVYERNLGPDSTAKARAITEFDPDASWRRATQAR